jgi:ankyrin repeat protein
MSFNVRFCSLTLSLCLYSFITIAEDAKHFDDPFFSDSFSSSSPAPAQNATTNSTPTSPSSDKNSEVDDIPSGAITTVEGKVAPTNSTTSQPAEPQIAAPQAPQPPESAPQMPAPQALQPPASAPQMPAPQALQPPASAPQMPAPQALQPPASAPQMPAPPAPQPSAPAPQASAPQAPQPTASAPQASQLPAAAPQVSAQQAPTIGSQSSDGQLSITKPESKDGLPSSYKDISKLSGKDIVDSAQKSTAPRASDVVNLSPKEVAAPDQVLPTIGGKAEKPKSKSESVDGAIDNIGKKIKKIKKSPQNIDDIKPVELRIGDEDTVDKELEDALAIILNSEPEHQLIEDASQSTRKVYDYRNRQPIPEELSVRDKKAIKNYPNVHIPSPAEMIDYSRSLFVAIDAQNIGAVKTLIDKGADINAKTVDFGITPLMYAINKGDYAIVKYLVIRGADLNATSQDGSTPLIMAAKYGRNDIIELLVDSGADLYQVDNKNKIAYDYLSPQIKEVVLINYAKNCSILEECLLLTTAQHSYYGSRILIERGAKIDFQDVNGNTPLIIAAMSGDYDLVNLLLTQGANPYVRNYDNKTALNYSFSKGYKNISLIIDTMETKLELEKPTVPLKHKAHQHHLPEHHTHVKPEISKLTKEEPKKASGVHNELKSLDELFDQAQKAEVKATKKKPGKVAKKPEKVVKKPGKVVKKPVKVVKKPGVPKNTIDDIAPVHLNMPGEPTTTKP